MVLHRLKFVVLCIATFSGVWGVVSAEQTSIAARTLIAAAISSQLRPQMDDFEINSEDQLRRAALDTRIKMVDLNHAGILEVLAQSTVGCGATGNCEFWIFQKSRDGYRLLLAGEAQTFTIQKSRTNGFSDIVLGMHGSATETGLTVYRYEGGVYQEVGCYLASWTILEGEEVRQLKEPLITACR